VEKEVCTTGDVVLSDDYNLADNMLGTYVWFPRGGGYYPRTVGGRIRVADEAIGGIGLNVWYPVKDSQALTSGFTAEFDAYMIKGGDIFSSNPADGMGFIVAQVPDCAQASTAQTVTEFDQVAEIGNPGATKDAQFDGSIYTSTASNGTDIWDCGDDCMYQFAEVTGDFDVAIEILSYAHETGVGRWGKFGLMARKDPTIRDSRFTMASVGGPAEPDQSRQMGRSLHGNGTNVCGGMYDWPWFGLPSYNLPLGQTQGTRFLRLVRRGNAFQAYGSNSAGLADGTLDPKVDCNWVPGAWDDWGADAQDTVSIGFANSEHGDGGAAVQTITYRILSNTGGTVAANTTRWFGGDGGGGIGYAWGDVIWNLRNNSSQVSFEVEFDNWTDWAMGNAGGGTNEPMPFGGSWRNDGSYHVGLNTNGSVSSVQQCAQLGHLYDLPAIYNGSGVHTKVVYKPEGFVDVYVSDAATPGVNELHVISSQVPMFTGPIVIGLAGATGGATTTEEFDNLVVTSNCCEFAPETADLTAAPASVEIPYAAADASTTLTATAGGIDAGATAAYSWSIVSDATGGAVLAPAGATATLTAAASGDVVVSVTVDDGVCAGSATKTVTVSFTKEAPPTNWRMGDANNDGKVDISDAVSFLSWKFLGGAPPACEKATNVNDDAQTDISDAVYLLGALFLGQAKPIIPGTDPDEQVPDVQACVKVPGCGFSTGCP